MQSGKRVLVAQPDKDSGNLYDALVIRSMVYRF
jgi:hypothetical protein